MTRPCSSAVASWRNFRAVPALQHSHLQRFHYARRHARRSSETTELAGREREDPRGPAPSPPTLCSNGVRVLPPCDHGGGGGHRSVPPVQANVASMDAIGDSISKGFDATDDGEFCEAEQESRNFSTGDTHGSDFCSDGGEGVFSHAERLECVQQK